MLSTDDVHEGEGVTQSHIAFYLSGPKKTIKFASVSPQVMFRLTTDISFDLPTYDPFKSDTKSVLMCPLQITSQH